MRALILAVVIALAPVAASAQSTQPSLSETVPVPREPAAGVTGWQMFAITSGAVAGAIAANIVTGGMITPVLTFGVFGPDALMAAEAVGAANMMAPVAAAPAAAVAPVVAETSTFLTMATQVAVTVGGAYVGGILGNWFYGR